MLLEAVRVELVDAAEAESSGDVISSDAVDLLGARGAVFLRSVATADETNRSFLEGSNTSSTEGFVELAGSEVVPSDDGVFVALEVVGSRHRWVRLSVDRTAATALGECFALVVGHGKRPAAAGADSDVLTVTSPAEVES